MDRNGTQEENEARCEKIQSHWPREFLFREPLRAKNGGPMSKKAV